ncbi:MAG: hypothetical protein RIR51_583 [Bacteroidota bacterium]
MKLLRFGKAGEEKPGVLVDGKILDLSAHFTDFDRKFFNQGGIEKLKEILEKNSNLKEVAPDTRLGSCVARPGKVLCIGLNYSDHAKESGMDIPKEPILFQKGSNTVIGPNDVVIIPRNSTKTDWEVELGVIIGKDARYLDSPEDSLDYVAGFCISNDVSERAFQLERGGQWTKGKSCDNFNPIGPYLVTKEEIEDPQNLKMELWVNGEKKQDGSSSTMIFNVKYLIHYLSQFMTLEAGDLITTGTPPGVGMGQNPPQYLKAGDIIELSIEGLGKQKQVCVDA